MARRSRCLLAVCVGLVEFAAVDSFPVEPLVLGGIVGFVSDNADLMTCGMGLLQEVTDVKTAALDMEKAVKGRNMTMAGEALEKLVEAFEKAPSARSTCKVDVDDMKAILRTLKKHHGLKDILSNIVKDDDKIFGEFEAAGKAFKKGDYLTAGEQVGMAFRRALVAEALPNASLAIIDETVSWKQILAGLAVGFVSDRSSDLVMCGMGMIGEVNELKQAVKDLEEAWKGKNITDVVEAVHAFGDVVNKAPGAKETCKVDMTDLKSILRVLKEHHKPKDILSNLVNDEKNISGAIMAAEKDYKSGDFVDAGDQLGMALRKMLVGEAAPTVVV